MGKTAISIRCWSAGRGGAFTRRTYELLGAYQADFGLSEEESGATAVLLASDFLIDTLGEAASWERFDTGAFGAFLRERVPPFTELLPGIVAALGGFFCFMCNRGVVSERRASSVVAAIYRFVPTSRSAA